ncbi:MAG: tyrosine-type recombinase/integrase [Candidatus Scatomorpha sp.]
MPVYANTPEELEAKVAARLVQIEEAKALAANPYVYQVAADWYATTTQRSFKRREDYRNAINRHICPVIGQMHISEVTAADIGSVMAAADGFSRSLQDKIASTLRQVFAYAEEREYIAESPCDKLKAGGKKPSEKNALTPEEQSTLLRVVAGQPIEGFVRLGLFAGLRREEILGLMWDCVVLDGPAPHVKVRRALRWEHNRPVVSDALKSYASRRDVPIPPQLSDWLREHQAASGYVICTEAGQPWSEASFKSAWGYIKRRQVGTVSRQRLDPKTGKLYKVQVEKKLGDKVPNSALTIEIDFPVTPHILRHTYATSLLMAGTNIKVVQHLLGHEKVDTTLNIYTHLMERSAEANIGAVCAAFGGVRG